MWTCPNCARNFKTTNQSHSCTQVDMGELFLGKPDELVMAFDGILMGVADWEPNSVGTAKKAIVFTNKKAWLIIKPMSKELDVKFYNDAPIDSSRFKKITPFGKRFGHHIRIQNETQLDDIFFELLRIGFDHALE